MVAFWLGGELSPGPLASPWGLRPDTPGIFVLAWPSQNPEIAIRLGRQGIHTSKLIVPKPELKQFQALIIRLWLWLWLWLWLVAVAVACGCRPNAAKFTLKPVKPKR